MYHCATFQLIWKTSDSETKFAQKVHGKNFEKINTKIKIRILQGIFWRIFYIGTKFA